MQSSPRPERAIADPFAARLYARSGAGKARERDFVRNLLRRRQTSFDSGSGARTGGPEPVASLRRFSIPSAARQRVRSCLCEDSWRLTLCTMATLPAAMLLRAHAKGRRLHSGVNRKVLFRQNLRQTSRRYAEAMRGSGAGDERSELPKRGRSRGMIVKFWRNVHAMWAVASTRRRDLGSAFRKRDREDARRLSANWLRTKTNARLRCGFAAP